MAGETGGIGPRIQAPPPPPTATIGPLQPGTAASIVRADLQGNPSPEKVQHAMDAIAGPNWTPAQREELLADLATDGTLTQLVNHMNRPPDMAQPGVISADAQRDFYNAIGANTDAGGLVTMATAITRSGAPGSETGVPNSLNMLTDAIGNRATDATKAQFVAQVTTSDVGPYSDINGNPQFDVPARLAAAVLPTIRSDAQFADTMRGLDASGQIPGVLRNVAGIQQTGHGYNSAHGVANNADALMSRVARLNDPALATEVLRAATTEQPAGYTHVPDQLAPAASRLLTEMPADPATGRTGAQRVVAELYPLADGDAVLGRMMAGLYATDRGDVAQQVANDAFANPTAELNGEHINARLAGFFLASTQRGTDAYNTERLGDIGKVIGTLVSMLPIPGGVIGNMVTNVVQSAGLDAVGKEMNADKRDFVNAVRAQAGIDTSSARDLYASDDTPAAEFITGFGSVGIRHVGE